MQMINIVQQLKEKKDPNDWKINKWNTLMNMEEISDTEQLKVLNI